MMLEKKKNEKDDEKKIWSKVQMRIKLRADHHYG